MQYFHTVIHKWKAIRDCECICVRVLFRFLVRIHGNVSFFFRKILSKWMNEKRKYEIAVLLNLVMVECEYPVLYFF